MMKSAICPNCGAELKEDESYHISLEDNYIADCIAGHCPSCEKEFQWVKLYGYEGVEDIEEVD